MGRFAFGFCQNGFNQVGGNITLACQKQKRRGKRSGLAQADRSSEKEIGLGEKKKRRKRRALGWAKIDSDQWIEFRSQRELYKERKKGCAARGDRVLVQNFRATVLAIRVDGDHSETSAKNAKIELQLCFRHDLNGEQHQRMGTRRDKTSGIQSGKKREGISYLRRYFQAKSKYREVQINPLVQKNIPIPNLEDSFGHEEYK